MEAPWRHHGKNHDSTMNALTPWKHHGPSRCFHGDVCIPMVLLWCCRGDIVHAWCSHGASTMLPRWCIRLHGASVVPPWCWRGASMRLWCFRCAPVLLPWFLHAASTVLYWCFNSASIEIWCSHRASMGVLWYLHGTVVPCWFYGGSMVAQWWLHGAYEVFSLCLRGTFLVLLWSFHETCMVRHLHGTFMVALKSEK